jgi:hypothetical protein
MHAHIPRGGPGRARLVAFVATTPFRSFFLALALAAALLPAAPGAAAIAGFDNGVSSTQNGSATVSGASVTLTHNVGDEAGSTFFNTRQQYATFTADFDYLANGSADGFSFTLENDPRGATALGDNGFALGYDGFSTPITNSASFLTSIFRGGVAYRTNGAPATGADFTSTGLALTGTSIHYHLTYDGTTLTALLTQGANSSTFTQATDLATILGGGGLAFVGFTGSDGGLTSTQVVSNFTFTKGASTGGSVPLPAAFFPGFALAAAVVARYRRC